MKVTVTTIRLLLGSRAFFYGILAFFALESIWIACSAVYPMAFDEDFHLGVIKIYSHHWLPFLSAQPDNATQFGALAADPSYLYHYLMSFPYRLLRLVTDNQPAQIIVLRLLNVGLAVWGVALFKKVLTRAGMSATLAHISLVVFVLIPIVPLLAGQINYDNLLLPLVALMFLLAFRVYGALRERRVDVRAVFFLVAVCMLAGLVKYAFLPLAAGAVLFLTVAFWRQFRGRPRTFRRAVQQEWRGLGSRTRIGLVVLLVVTAGLCMQRYGLNMVRYHTPIPECDAVLTETECRGYGPWLRNYELAHIKTAVDTNPFAYTWQWVQALHYRMFFAVNGPADSYRNYPPLPLPSAAVVVLFVSGAVALILFGRQVFRGRPFLILLGVSVLLYCGVLWAEDYSQYLETGEPVAINGRYVLPVLLPLAVVFGRAFQVALRHHWSLKPWVAAMVLLLFLQGGGVGTFILRSDEIWYWPNPAVVHMNNAARRVLAPVIIEGPKYYF